MVHFTEEGDDGLAPIIPLFGGRVPEQAASASEWRSTWHGGSEAGFRAAGEPAVDADLQPVDHHSRGAEVDRGTGASAAAEDALVVAERVLLRKLHARQLSASEARTVLREQGVDGGEADELLEEFAERGYLDDASLAEQLVHVGVDRKGQGRQAIAMAMSKRGIPRDVADAALSELPDDDLERALDYARNKARSMAALDRDAALRRLAGQLARRGYSSSIALTAARRALDDAGGSAVRFR